MCGFLSRAAGVSWGVERCVVPLAAACRWAEVEANPPLPPAWQCLDAAVLIQEGPLGVPGCLVGLRMPRMSCRQVSTGNVSSPARRASGGRRASPEPSSLLGLPVDVGFRLVRRVGMGVVRCLRASALQP